MRDFKKEAGKYTRHIRIEARSGAVDADYGTPTGAWVTVATVWAWFMDELPSRAEGNAGGLRVGQRPTVVRIRYRTDITADMRIVDLDRGSALYKIVAGPAEIGRKGGLEMMAVLYTSEGDAA